MWHYEIFISMSCLYNDNHILFSIEFDAQICIIYGTSMYPCNIHTHIYDYYNFLLILCIHARHLWVYYDIFKGDPCSNCVLILTCESGNDSQPDYELVNIIIVRLRPCLRFIESACYMQIVNGTYVSKGVLVTIRKITNSKYK